MGRNDGVSRARNLGIARASYFCQWSGTFLGCPDYHPVSVRPILALPQKNRELVFLDCCRLYLHSAVFFQRLAPYWDLVLRLSHSMFNRSQSMEEGAEPMNTYRKYKLGVVIGKFLPPHRGHRYLIETAIERCIHVVVIVCERIGDAIPGELRATWLREMVPSAEIKLIDDRYDEHDSRIWATNTIQWIGRAPDAVFTSESYGDAYARHLGCVHEMIDPCRGAYPCSGTAVRNDPFAMWEYLDEPVKAWYVKKIVVVGAESTGTTTLAQDLAEELRTVWVPEYGREYSAWKQKVGETEWRSEEFIAIAKEHARREDLSKRKANRYMVCDTDALATTLWHRRYMGFDSGDLKAFSEGRRPSLYLLTGDEIPFVQDGLRDGLHVRHKMHAWFIDTLNKQPVPWRLVMGTPRDRLEKATASVAELGLGPRTKVDDLSVAEMDIGEGVC